VLGSFLTEDPSQRGDALSQVVLFDSRIDPDCTQKCFFAEDRVGILDQIKQRIEGFRRERQWTAIPPEQQTPAWVNAEIAELVDVRPMTFHEAFRSLQKFSAYSKDFAASFK
jgi:hypothetical protein